MTETARDKILLVDDEEDVATFFKQTFLNFKNIEFLTANRADVGIDIALKEKPKLIMLDLRMPGIGGEEALKMLKKELPETKFIIMTGWDDAETKNRIVHEIGVDAFFQKPIDLEKVITKIFSLIMVT